MSSTTDNEQRFAYLLSPEFQIVNTAGKPLTGGWIEVYIHGTRVKYYCFSDFDGTLHPFQIPLDSLGSNIVLASPTHAYDIYIYNKFGALVMSRYNVVPACNAADIVEDVVVIDSPDETINVTCDGGSNWHLAVNTDLIATTEQLASVSGDLQDQIDNKKDLQLPYVASGTVTKTITKIEQNENGEIEVTYSDIDLPPQVPNIDIISPSGTIDVSSVVNPSTNTKTFKIDIHKTKMDFFDGYCGKYYYEDRSSSSISTFGGLYVDQWDEYKYQGDFIANSWQDENNTTFKLNSGLYLITASIRYQMNSDYNKEEYIRIATGAYNGLENGTRYKDWSYEKELGASTAESSIQVSFIRNVEDDDDYLYMNGNHDLYFYPYLPDGVNYAFIDHLQIVKLDSIAGAGGGSGPRYIPGYGIEILDDVIQVATGTVVTNNYFNTVVSSINNEINEISTTIQNVTGDITELSEAVTNIIGATGDYATTDYVDAAVSGLENYSAGQYISIEDHVINVTGLQPEGDYATNEDLQIVSGAIPESQEVEFEELDLAQFAQASAVTVIQNQVNNVTGDINNINEAVTNIIGATGDYATEEYVDEAIAAVTGQQFEQVNSDWLATSGVAEILNKPDVFQLIAGDNIDITPSGNDLVISASGDVDKAYVDEQIAEVSAIIPSLDGYATEEYVDNKVASATFEQVNSDWLATSGVAEILNKPLEANIVAGQNISIVQEYDNVIISATGIPSLDGYATEQYVDEAIVAATGMIPEAQVNADWLATSGKAEILNKPQEEAVEFEEVNLEDYALASAIPDISNLATKTEVDAVSGKLPTTEIGKFTIQNNVSGGPIEVNCPTDQSREALLYQINSVSGNAYTDSSYSGVVNYYYGETPADFNGNDDTIVITVNDSISNLSSIICFYSDSVSGTGGPMLTYSAINCGPNYILQSGIHKVKAQYNHAGTSGSYGKYLQIMFSWKNYATDAAESLQWTQAALSKITFFGVVRPDPALGTLVNLDRYYLGNTNADHAYVQAAVYTDPFTKKQTVYMPTNMPSNWIPTIIQTFQYGSNYNSPLNSSYSTKQYRAYKYTSSPERYQFAYLTDWNAANKLMTFIAYDNSGNAIEKWTLNYTNSSSNVWRTETLDYVSEVELQAVSGALNNYVPYSASGVSLPNSKFEIDTEGQAYKVITTEIDYSRFDTGIYFRGDGSSSIGTYKATLPSNVHHIYIETYGGAIVTGTYDIATHSAIINVSSLPSNSECYVFAYDSHSNLIELSGSNTTVKYITPPVTEEYITETALAEAISAVTGIIPSDVVTEQELADAIDAATGLIPDVSNLEADIQTVSGAVDAVSGAIPESEEVQFEELDLSIYATNADLQTVSGAIPSDVVTHTELNDAIDTVTGLIPEEQVNADWTATSGKAEILNKPESEEVQFEAVDLSNFASASAVNQIETDVANLVAATGDYLTQQVNADWEANSGAAEILNKPVEYELVAGNNIEIIASGGNVIISSIGGGAGDVTEAELATVSGTLEAEIQTVSAAIPDTSIYATETDLQTVSAAIPESESVEFEELDLSDYALASAIPDVSNINTAITNLVAATGDYLQSSDLNGYATEAYVDAAITGTTFEQVNSDWNATSGVAEILNKPVPKEVEFKEVDLSDFALASAVPDVTALEAEIQTVSAAIPDTSSFATETDLQTVSGAVDAVSGSIPESEEVEFEEVDLSDYAPASAIPSLAGYATETYVNAAVSGKQDVLTGITDVQVVNSLPASPVATVLYLIPEA